MNIKKMRIYIVGSKIKKYFFASLSFIYFKLKPIKCNILSFDETISKISENAYSIVRYGDGEFRAVHGTDIANQKYSNSLKYDLINILEDPNSENTLLCLPDVFNGLSEYRIKTKITWLNQMFMHRKIYRQYINQNTIYGNAFISRPYIVYKNKAKAREKFNKLKQVWKNKNIVILEGKYSRNGVGNDLFDNTLSIERIICPPKNAYDFKEKILSLFEKVDKNKLILISLGAAAKPITYELTAKFGFQAIDLGHIDSEYEWYLSQAKEKMPISNKHAAEQPDIEFEECKDEKYLNEIIYDFTK